MSGPDSAGVAFRTLGCKVNRVESESIAAELLGRGARIVDEAEAAVVVVSTCTVTREADAKDRKAIRHALAAAGAPTVLVTGCGATMDPDALAALGSRVVVEPDKSRVASRVAELLALDRRGTAVAPRTGQGFRTRALLKVQDGCDAFCAYCIVPYARGVPRAVPVAEVRAEAKALVSAGAREIVLTGINIGRYSDGDARLSDVIETVAASGIERLRLSSIEPLDLTPELVALLASTPSFCPHLHVPLQSGSDAVLSAMGRRYTAAQYLERISEARDALSGLAVTTDVLCGFPGETDEQAEETLRFCEELEFSSLHVFRFSARPGTPAATMPITVPPTVAAERAALLRESAERLRAAHAARRVGTVADVLVETIGADGLGRGTTEDYLRVSVPVDASQLGKTLRVRLESDEAGSLTGRPVPAAC